MYALGLLGNAADAEEVLQETNLVLWRKFDQYQPGTEFDEALAAEAEATMDLLDTRRQALQGCLQKLTDSDRRLVMHRYQEGATTSHVAAALGRSVQGTRKSLHRIRAADPVGRCPVGGGGQGRRDAARRRRDAPACRRPGGDRL